jgi:uncharacterized protein YggE
MYTRQASRGLKTVQVDGVGVVSRPPDSLRASVAVEVTADKLEAAREQAAAKTRSLMEALERLEIPSLKVRTANIAVTPLFAQERGPLGIAPPQIIGYEATSRVWVTLAGVSPATLRAEGPRILDEVLASGANQISGIRFFLSKPQQAYREALKASIKDAEKNAAAIADAANLKLVGWRSVSTSSEEDMEGHSLRMAPAMGGAAEATALPVEPEAIVVTASVKARFQFRGGRARARKAL